MSRPETIRRAFNALTAAGLLPDDAQRALDALQRHALSIADDNDDELVTRWVDVQVRAVPPEADTIIRTITTTVGTNTWSTTHWLDGLRGPRSAQLR
ncbi:MAG: hypothetical protein RL701_378 [Pseudomonadota bacterium]|jgi:hypothetical protein